MTLVRISGIRSVVIALCVETLWERYGVLAIESSSSKDGVRVFQDSFWSMSMVILCTSTP